MNVMTQADIFANKLVAMVERHCEANRDIFDVWFFLSKHWPINADIIRTRTAQSLPEFLQTCISALEKKSSQSILSGIGELLDDAQKTWVKQSLVLDTLFFLRQRLN